MKPLVDCLTANLDYFHIRELMKKTDVPDFRFEAVEEQFAIHFTRICCLLRDYQAPDDLSGNPRPKLTDPFDIRQMLKTIRIENWPNIHPLAYYMTPLKDAFDTVVKEMLEMHKLGPLRCKYIVEMNHEMREKVLALIGHDVTVQWLAGDSVKIDQFKFIYEVHKIIYDCGLRDLYLSEQTNADIIQNVIPCLAVLKQIQRIMTLEDKKVEDKIKQAEKEARLAEYLGTQEPEQPDPEEVAREAAKKAEEEKKKKKKPKVEEVDPEVLEAERRRLQEEEELRIYGVSSNSNP